MLPILFFQAGGLKAIKPDTAAYSPILSARFLEDAGVLGVNPVSASLDLATFWLLLGALATLLDLEVDIGHFAIVCA